MTDVCFRLYVESKRFILTEAKQRMVMARSWGKGKKKGIGKAELHLAVSCLVAAQRCISAE